MLASRAIQLYHSGSYNTSDHKNIHDLTQSLNNVETYKNKLKQLREDRNLADYDHSASEDDLVLHKKTINNWSLTLLMTHAFLEAKG